MIQQMIQFPAGNDASFSDIKGNANLRSERQDGQDTRFRDELESSMKKHSEFDFLKNENLKQDNLRRDNLARQEIERDNAQKSDMLRQDAQDLATGDRLDRESLARDRKDQENRERKQVASSSKKDASHSIDNQETLNEDNSNKLNNSEPENKTTQSEKGDTGKSRDVKQIVDKKSDKDISVDVSKEVETTSAVKEGHVKSSKSENEFASLLKSKLSKIDGGAVEKSQTPEELTDEKLNENIQTLRFNGSEEEPLIKETPFQVDDKSASGFVEELKSENLTLNPDKKSLLKNQKNKDKKPVVSVEDQRTQKTNPTITNEKIVSLKQGEKTGADKNIILAKAQKNPSDVLAQMEVSTKESGEKTAVKEMAFYLKEDSTSSEVGVGKGQSPVIKESEAAFRNFLQDQGNAEIAKNIKFILKNNQQGEIRLILKPEALGKVKINLRMAENGIKGQIIVENSNTGDIFKDNIDRLNALLKEAGFESSQLDVSVGDGRERSGSDKNEEKRPFFSERLKEVEDFVLDISKIGNEAGHLDLVI